MEKQITAAALVLSVAGLGILKAQQMERMEAQSIIDAESAMVAADMADEASRLHFEVPHDRDASSSEMEIVLDGASSFDNERDSLTFNWAQTEGPDVQLAEEQPGRSSFKATPGKYTFELTVTDAYGESGSASARLSVLPEPNQPPEVAVVVYARE
jgi:Tfp pilus assembly protein PilV